MRKKNIHIIGAILVITFVAIHSLQWFAVSPSNTRSRSSFEDNQGRHSQQPKDAKKKDVTVRINATVAE